MNKLCVNAISGWRTKVATLVSEMHRFTSRETAELQSWGKRMSNFDSRLLFSVSGTLERVSSNSELSLRWPIGKKASIESLATATKQIQQWLIGRDQ